MADPRRNPNGSFKNVKDQMGMRSGTDVLAERTLRPGDRGKDTAPAPQQAAQPAAAQPSLEQLAAEEEERRKRAEKASGLLLGYDDGPANIGKKTLLGS